MKTLTHDIEFLHFTQIHPHPENANRGDLQAIKESIQTNGFFGALVVQRSTGRILTGHHRYQAALELGYTELPVLQVDVTDQEARRILVADNRTTRLGHDDPEQLAALLNQILADHPEDALSGTGFSEDDLQDLLSSIHPEPKGLATPPDEHNYKEQYGVIVVCDSEKHQEEVYNTLKGQGLNCKVVVT